MDVVATGKVEQSIRGHKEDKPPDFLALLVDDYFLQPNIFSALTYLNITIGYFVILAIIANFHFSYWISFFYFVLIYILFSWRKSKRKKDTRQIAHRLPFFTDALANSLSAGATLEQAFIQSAYYLKGKIKTEFDQLIIKNSLGKDLGTLLWELDRKFPNTGLRYLISLLEEYQELGIGISPFLKKISVALSEKEEAEAKIEAILSSGSTYARLSIFVFAGIFLAMSYMLRDQISLLLSPDLKNIFFFLITWTCTGLLIVSRMSSIEFTRNFSLRPFIQPLLKKKKFSWNESLYYSGMDWSKEKRLMLLFFPLIMGFFFAYTVSWYSGAPLIIVITFAVSTFLFRRFTAYILKGMVEDQLIKVIEVFPEILQVFTIGLNSGLNNYMAFQFAQDAVRGVSPRILTEELSRVKFAMQCGEDYSRTWQQLAEHLPFETIIDFCEIMVIAPMHGESIVQSITQMTTSYEKKKLLIIEKKATTLAQLVIPIIVFAFFPLFLFAVFAPLVLKMGVLFKS